MEIDEVVAYSSQNIDNIDLENKDDPQMVTEYVNEIHGYMRFLENKQSIREKYLDGHKLTAGEYESRGRKYESTSLGDYEIIYYGKFVKHLNCKNIMT